MTLNLTAAETVSGDFDVVCFSHLRWDFVFQRPQHLMTRFAGRGRMLFIEEPVVVEGEDRFEVSDRGSNVLVCVPHVNPNSTEADIAALVSGLASQLELSGYIVWFYTPMMLNWAQDLTPQAVVYDCMDELSNFKNAPAELVNKERDLFSKSDLVFTGGHSLYEVKRQQHSAVHAFPSSIDATHFSATRDLKSELPESESPAGPVIGFIGVIDERLDIELLGAVADLRPELEFRMIGPIVKISEEDLPRRANIKYLGQKSYDELPGIMSEWDVAMMPFAINDSTRYISPTKTPEYLAAGLPVVSTAITDVVKPYGDKGLAFIASTAEEFADSIDRALQIDINELRTSADDFLSDKSWDITFEAMRALIDEARSKNDQPEAEAAFAAAGTGNQEFTSAARSAQI